MFIGYVSDENYLALAEVILDFECDGKRVATARSSATGAVEAEIARGNYTVSLCKTGYGSKRVVADLTGETPFHFRLLSDAVYGYAWPKWTKAGRQSEFRVHAVEMYYASLWRYGWKKELIQSLGCFDEHAPRPNMQITPDTDYTQTGVRWNHIGYPKNYSAQSVIAPERSGLYYFHVETASGKFFNFPWVVAPEKPSAQIAVLASTNTWNAYNNFGGRSNYINPTRLPTKPTVNSRQDLSRYTGATGVWHSANDRYAPLSFDRPEPYNLIEKETNVIDPIRGRQGCHLAPAEWRLLGWLERESFDYDFYSDHQLHSGELDLDAYKILIISTHPEYWSRAAYDKVKKWVQERGGKLLYLGGNGIDCEIDFLDAATMRCKTWLPNPTGALQFVEPKSGKKYDCRFHYFGESPAELLGVVFTEPGAMTAAPYRVKENSAHWIFEGTNLRMGATFGAKSLHERCPGGASGHETDKRTASSPENGIVLAKGNNSCDGGAEMVYYETKSGGAVFSVGSITWPACLLVDENVSRITRNVLEKFLGRS